jgi:chloramphenicol 3-O phosphotransferase
VSSIIFLHGASSAGKSTLARAIRDRAEVPFWHYSIDHLRDSGVLPSERIVRGDFAWRDMRPGFFAGFHRSIGSFAAAGNNLVVEHILDTEGWLATLAEILAPHDLLFVGLHVPLEELNRREMARGNRPVGMAAADHASVHKGLRYDLAVDASRNAAENAERVLTAWRAPRSRSVFFEVAGRAA